MGKTEENDWDDFYKLTSERPPWATLLNALENFEQENMSDLPKMAVDLGSGAGRDTFELLKHGWNVLAVDAQPEAAKWIRSKASSEQQEKLETLTLPFEELALPPTTLVNASYALPFCAADQFNGLWEKIVTAIQLGGRFSGHFFGDNDEWVDDPIPDTATHHHTKAQVEALFQGFQFELFDERDEDGTVASGSPKHWHVFSVVAKKLASS